MSSKEEILRKKKWFLGYAEAGSCWETPVGPAWVCAVHPRRHECVLWFTTPAGREGTGPLDHPWHTSDNRREAGVVSGAGRQGQTVHLLESWMASRGRGGFTLGYKILKQKEGHQKNIILGGLIWSCCEGQIGGGNSTADCSWLSPFSLWSKSITFAFEHNILIWLIKHFWASKCYNLSHLPAICSSSQLSPQRALRYTYSTYS